MEKEKLKKISFFKKMLIAIKDFDKYKELLKENIVKSINYLIKLMLIFSILVCIPITYKFSKSLDNGKKYLEGFDKEISFEYGELNVSGDEPVIVKSDEAFKFITIIDTKKIDEETLKGYEEELSKYENGIIILNKEVIYKNYINTVLEKHKYDVFQEVSNNILFRSKYEELDKIVGDVDLSNKEELIAFIELIKTPTTTTVFISSFIVVFAVFFIYAIRDILILSLIGAFASLIYRVNLRYVAVIKIAIYSITISTILKLIYMIVNILTGFVINEFYLMYMLINFICLITAILMLRIELIKQQIEISAIIEQQKQVKQELDDNKEKEEEQNQQEQNKDESKNDKRKDEKKQKQEKENKNQEDGLVESIK